MSGWRLGLRVVILLFTKRRKIVNLIKEIEDVVIGIRKARAETGEGGKQITKAEMVTLLDEADDVLTRAKELLQ